MRSRCSFESPREFSHVDNDPGMRPGSDLLGALGCSHGELDLAPVDFRHLSLPGDQASNRRRREMANVDGGADRALTGIEIGSDCIEGSVFHDHDHHGGSEHRRQDRVLEPVRKMLGLHEKAEGALGSKGYLPHGLPSKRPAATNMLVRAWFRGSYASPGGLSSIATPRLRTCFAIVSRRSCMIHGRSISTRTTSSRTWIRPVIRCHIADATKLRVSPSQW